MPPPPTDDELEAAAARLAARLDPGDVDALQPAGPSAVYTGWVVVYLLVYQRLHNATLAAAVAHPVGDAAPHVPAPSRAAARAGTLSGNTAGYSRARTRLRTAVAGAVCDRVAAAPIAAAPAAYAGRRVFAVDGTGVALPRTTDLLEAFPPPPGPQGTAHRPKARVAVAHDVVTGCCVRPEAGPRTTSEVVLAEAVPTRPPPRSVAVADRAFGIFSFVYAAARLGHDAVARVKKDRFDARTRGAEFRDGAWHLDWKPTADERRKRPDRPKDAAVRVRFVAVPGDPGGDGEPLYFVTTLAAPPRRRSGPCTGRGGRWRRTSGR